MEFRRSTFDWRLNDDDANDSVAVLGDKNYYGPQFELSSSPWIDSQLRSKLNWKKFITFYATQHVR